MSPEDDLLLRLDRESAASTERVKALLMEAGRPDLVADLDARMRDIRSGVDGARSCWHSISPAQRRVLETLEPGRWLIRQRHSREVYDAHGEPHALANVCRAPTVRNLLHRGLIEHHDRGGLRIVLSERGRFVLAHGRPLEARGQ